MSIYELEPVCKVKGLPIGPLELGPWVLLAKLGNRVEKFPKGIRIGQTHRIRKTIDEIARGAASYQHHEVFVFAVSPDHAILRDCEEPNCNQNDRDPQMA